MRVSLYLILMLLWPMVGAAQLSNRLHGHASPYLQMHGDDPVAWQQWGAAALEEAKRQNKLLFVSVGYFSCHWCHVMHRESYSDKAVAELMNKYFIPVKVDRELDPALDARLVDFVQRTRGYAGWPLNVFVTPEGYPLIGVVYLPNAEFQSLLKQVQQLWRDNNAYLKSTARSAAEQIAQEATLVKGEINKSHSESLKQRFLQHVWQIADELAGGFGDQSKFPMVPQLQALLVIYQGEASTRLKEFLELTLDQMATQSLRDQLDRGFFRYTIDPA